MPWTTRKADFGLSRGWGSAGRALPYVLPVTTDLVSHFHASDLAGDSTYNGSRALGNFVQQWTARAGSSLLTFDQLSSDADVYRPVLMKGRLNGKDYLHFEGEPNSISSTQFREITGSLTPYNFIHQTGDFHIFLVVNCLRYGTAGPIFSNAYTSTQHGIYIAATTTHQVNAYLVNGTGVTMATVTSSGANLLIPGRWHVIEVYGSGVTGVLSVSVDGASPNNSAAITVVSASNATALARIGRNTTNVSTFNGGIADILIYDNKLSLSNQASVLTSLQSHYNLTNASVYQPKLIFGLGDSIIAGSSSNSAFPFIASQQAGSNWMTVNWGWGSGKLLPSAGVEIRDNWNNNIETRYAATPGTKNVFLLAGINDIIAASTASDIWNTATYGLKALIDEILGTSGFRLICLNLLPCYAYLDDTLSDAARDAAQIELDALNDEISNYCTAQSIPFIDANFYMRDEDVLNTLSDGGTKGNFTAANPSGTDKLHPNFLGHTYLASQAATAAISG